MSNAEKLAIQDFLTWAIKNVPKLKAIEQRLPVGRLQKRVEGILESIEATLDVVQEEVPKWDSGG